MTLTESQRQAVEREGQDVCVVAGPGSGKTRVLIERFAWLIEKRGVAPGRILAITFTEKAATEIKERLLSRFSENPNLREAIERAWVSTIDAFCARVLAEHAIDAGVAPDFQVLDEAQAYRIQREAVEESLDALFAEDPAGMRQLLESLDSSTYDDPRQPDLARSILNVYETMRVAGKSEAQFAAGDVLQQVREHAAAILRDRDMREAHVQLRGWAKKFLALPAELSLEHFRLSRIDVNLGKVAKNAGTRDVATRLKNDLLPCLTAQWIGEWHAPSLDLLRSAVARFEIAYQEKKRREGALDFADLEEFAIRLLQQNDEVRHEITGGFDQILMDELQDTNRLQWRLLNFIRRPARFFAVGDINQSIYSFRHAEPRVFEEFRSGIVAAGGAIDDLRENHRSRDEILGAVHRTLDGQPGIEPRPLIAAGDFAERADPSVERLVGSGDLGPDAEASLVAARIRELIEEDGCDYRNIAVLVRALNALEPFERAFDRFAIPFLVSGGRRFLEARETRDLMALLAALVNPMDEVALAGVLRSPLGGLDDEELFRLGREGWRAEFQKLFGQLRPLAGLLPPDRILARAVDESGYAARLSTRARANVDKLLAWLRSEYRSRPRPLAEILDDLESLREMQSEAEAPPEAAGNLVRLMSIHAAKGLEFNVVFVAGLHRGPDRSQPVVAFSPAFGMGAKWRHPALRESCSDASHKAIHEETTKREREEENRLLYVAMTRAEDRLVLSYSEKSRSSPWRKLIEKAVVQARVAETPLDPQERPSAAKPAPATEEFLLPPPVLSKQYDSSAPVTSVAMFHACPRRYFLDRYLGLAPDLERATGEGGGRALGTEVHAILAGDSGDASTEARELAARFSTSELGLRAAQAQTIEREFDFMLAIHDVVLRGQIDLWFEEADELVLIDYKTDRDEDRGGVDYALQLRLYALAIEGFRRLPDRAVLHYLRSNRSVEVGLGATELQAARAAVLEFRTAQETLDFQMHEGPHCRRCPFFGDRCPAVVAN